jgi:hypothetical protein
MKLVRTDENKYQIEGLDRETIRDITVALQAYIVKAQEKGYHGFRFEPIIELIRTKNLKRMRIKKINLQLNQGH